MSRSRSYDQSPGILTREDVDLNEFPITSQKYKSIGVEDKNELLTQVSIGDTHGNALKLLYFLLKEEVITLDEASYKAFVQIYKAEADAYNKDTTLTDEVKSQIDEIFSKVKIHHPIKGVRLIGDEMADRGANDFFNLKIFQTLHELNIPFEIMASDHGMDFLLLQEMQKHVVSDLEMIQSQLQFLKTLPGYKADLTYDEDAREKLMQDLKTYYFPYVKLFGYSLSNSDPQNITIFLHTVSDVRAVKEMCILFDVPFSAKNAKDLASTIDHLNATFQAILMDDKKRKDLCEKYFNVLACQQQSNPSSQQINDAKKYIPFYALVWRRYKDYRINKHKKLDALPQLHDVNGFKIFYVHGHDTNYEGLNVYGKRHVINLDQDNELGKSRFEESFKGPLYVSTHEGESSLQVKERLTPVSNQNTQSQVEIKEEKRPVSDNPKTNTTSLIDRLKAIKLNQEKFKKNYKFLMCNKNNFEQLTEDYLIFKNLITKTFEEPKLILYKLLLIINPIEKQILDFENILSNLSSIQSTSDIDKKYIAVAELYKKICIPLNKIKSETGLSQEQLEIFKKAKNNFFRSIIANIGPMNYLSESNEASFINNELLSIPFPFENLQIQCLYENNAKALQDLLAIMPDTNTSLKKINLEPLNFIELDPLTQTWRVKNDCVSTISSGTIELLQSQLQRVNQLNAELSAKKTNQHVDEKFEPLISKTKSSTLFAGPKNKTSSSPQINSVSPLPKNKPTS